jgi:SAM-dependent methyltransferase
VDSEEQARARIAELVDAAWALAAVAALLHRPADPLGSEHGAVLGLAGLAEQTPGGAWVPSHGLAELLADPQASGSLNILGSLRQMVAAASGKTGWANHDEATLRAQGDASMAISPIFLTRIATRVPGLDALLRMPGAVFLDVGTGTGGIPAGLGAAIPTLRFVGLDVLPAALDMARERVSAVGVADRVEFRLCDVAELTDRDAYDVAWLPTIFISQETVRAALPRLRDAVKPGGVMIFGLAGYHGATRSDAITAWRVVSDGGTAWTAADMAEAATAAGFADVAEVPALPGAATFLIARRPA